MQRVKHIILGIVACWTVSIGYAQDSTKAPGQVYTLQQCVDIALKNNSTVKTDVYTNQIQKENQSNAFGQMLPFVSATGANSSNYGRNLNTSTYTYVNTQNTLASYSASAQITVWNASNLRNYYKSQAATFKGGEIDVQNARDQTTITIILDYLNVLAAIETLNVARASLVAINEGVRVEQEKQNVGSVHPGDYYNLKGSQGTSQLAVTNAINALTQAKLQLTQDMNISYDSTIAVTPIDAQETMLTPYSSNVDDIYTYAVHNLAVIRSVDYKEQSAKYAFKSARGQYYPSIYLFGNIGTNYSNTSYQSKFIDSSYGLNSGYYTQVGTTKNEVLYDQANYNSTIPWHYFPQLQNNVYYNIGLQINIPILQGFGIRTKVRTAKINQQMATFNKETAHIQLRQAIEKDYVNMTSAYASYKALVQQTKDYTSAYNIAQAQLDVGAIDSYVFIQAKNNIDGANNNLISYKYNYILYTKILDYFQGHLSY